MGPPTRGLSHRGRLSARSQRPRSSGGGLSKAIKGALLFFVIIWAFRLWRSVSTVPRASASLSVSHRAVGGGVGSTLKGLAARASSSVGSGESLPLHRKLVSGSGDGLAGGSVDQPGAVDDDNDDDDDDDDASAAAFAGTAGGLFRSALLSAARQQDAEEDQDEQDDQAGADRGLGQGDRSASAEDRVSGDRGLGQGDGSASADAALLSDGGEDLVAVRGDISEDSGDGGGADLTEAQYRAIGEALMGAAATVEARERGETTARSAHEHGGTEAGRSAGGTGNSIDDGASAHGIGSADAKAVSATGVGGSGSVAVSADVVGAGAGAASSDDKSAAVEAVREARRRRWEWRHRLEDRTADKASSESSSGLSGSQVALASSVASSSSSGSSSSPTPRRRVHRQRRTRTPVEPMPAPVAARSLSRTELNARRDSVVEATRRAWRGFERYAWGADELRPVSLEGASGFGGLGATPIDALDTLLMMGLDEEAARAREWVLYELNVTSETQVSVFETTIRVVGGLLAAYELSGDRLYVDKARDMAVALLPAYATESGIPYNSIYLNNGSFHVPKGARHNIVGLAEAGTQALELRRLSELTGDWRFAELSLGALEFLAARHPDEPLLPIAIDVRDGTLRSTKKSLGAVGDSYFEYLLKLWLASGKTEEHLRKRWQDSVDAALDQLLARSSDGHLYVAEFERRRPRHRMDHLACFYPGSLALGIAEGAVRGGPEVEARYLAVAEGLAATCWAMYARQKTELSPEFVYFDREKGMLNGARYYLQRPEAIEAFWYLFRLTGNPVYREWGWRIFQSIERRCRVDAGYHGLHDVSEPNGEPDDLQQSFFLAETLKYLYLLFSEEDPFAWSQVILNTEAHPIRVAERWLPDASQAAVDRLANRGRKAHDAAKLTKTKLDASKRLRDRDDARRREQVRAIVAARAAAGDVFATQTVATVRDGGSKAKLPSPRQREIQDALAHIEMRRKSIEHPSATKILMGADAIAQIMRDTDDAHDDTRAPDHQDSSQGVKAAKRRSVMQDEDLGVMRVTGRRGIQR